MMKSTLALIIAIILALPCFVSAEDTVFTPE